MRVLNGIPVEIIWNLGGYNIAYVYGTKNNIRDTIGIKREMKITMNKTVKIIESINPVSS